MGYEIKLFIIEGGFGSSTIDKNLYVNEHGNTVLLYNDESGNFYYYNVEDKKVFPKDSNIEENMKSASFASVIASIDMCRVGGCNLSKLDEESNKNLIQRYFYADCGETIMFEDPYGQVVRVHKIEDVLDALEKDCLSDDYRRFKTARDLLKSMHESDSYNDLQVLFYAH